VVVLLPFDFDDKQLFAQLLQEDSVVQASLDEKLASLESQAEQVTAQLTQAQADLENVRKQYDTLKTETDTMKVQHAQELMGLQVDNEIRSAMGGIKFKAEFPQAVTDTILNQAIAKIKGMNPEFVDDGQGGKRLVFNDANGAIMRNPDNRLEAYTAAELLTKELKTMGVLDEGRKGAGAGSAPAGG
jgi:Asp-tRNA(Asn)/Glu-tRNA(Gln) amidotransferase B subunit